MVQARIYQQILCLETMILMAFRYGYGVAPNYCISADISNNKIHQSASATSLVMEFEYYGSPTNTNPEKITIHDNDIYLNYGYGIYAYYAYGVASDPTSIYNNAIVFKNSGTSYNYGMYIYHPQSYVGCSQYG